jgi:proteasome lid subunit RPN8/RPN11
MNALLCKCLTNSPKEQVGLLLGSGLVVCTIAPLTNHHPGRRGFRVRRDEIAVLQKHTRAAGLEVTGRYHTHIHAPAIPSEADRLSLPESWIELIASVTGPREARRLTEFRAWRSDGRELALHWPEPEVTG